MKLLAIVIVCGLAVQDSLAQLETGSLTAAFVTGGNSVPSSTIEGQLTENLREIILNETALYIIQIVNDLARQINIQSHLEVTVLKLAQETFNYELEQLPVDSTADSLDLALQSLNQNIVGAFNMIPTTLGGNAVIKPKKSSTKKDKKPSSEKQKPPKVHTLSELINNFGQILEKDLETLYKFQKKLLSAGYEGVDDTASLNLQEEFRTWAINGHIVPALQSIVNDVQANADIVQAHVNALTWSKFVALNDQLSTVMTNVGITTTTELTETTVANEITETTEVASEANEVTEITEIASEANEVTEITEVASEVNEVTEITEIASEANEVTEESEDLQTTETIIMI